MTTTLTSDQIRSRLHDLGVDASGLDDTEAHRLLIRTLSQRLNGTIEAEATGELEADGPGPGAQLVVPQRDLRPQIPTAAVWAHLAAMAEPLAKSNLVKPALRGKPNDVLMVLLTGYDLQITMTQALAKVHIIEGQPAASPELILGLIRREGHKVWPGGPDNSGTVQESEDVRTLTGIVHAVRKDDPERVITVTYTVAQAEQAGLVGVDENGRLSKRSKDGKALPWQQYPEDLLWARAVSRLGRRSFSDVLLGLSYVPEELGYIDAASYEAPVPAEPEMLPSRREELRTRIADLPEDVRSRLYAQWKKLMEARALPPLDALRDHHYDAANDLVTNYERQAQSVEVPLVQPPCEGDAAVDQGALDLRRETGLPFPCEDFEQAEPPRTCPTPGQCAEAGECLRSPI